MKRVLFIVSSDPRTSDRPAEAIRIAAGAGAWRRAEINVCLTGSAALVLDENGEALKDADQLEASLPIVREVGRPIYVLKGATGGIENAAVHEIDVKELARLALQHDVVVRF